MANIQSDCERRINIIVYSIKFHVFATNIPTFCVCLRKGGMVTDLIFSWLNRLDPIVWLIYVTLSSWFLVNSVTQARPLKSNSPRFYFPLVAIVASISAYLASSSNERLSRQILPSQHLWQFRSNCRVGELGRKADKKFYVRARQNFCHVCLTLYFRGRFRCQWQT